MRPYLVTPSTTVFVSLADAKAHLRVVEADDDSYIGGLIRQAMSELEGWSGALGRCIVRQSWAFDLPGFNDTDLPFPDVNPDSVTVTYTDAAGAPQVLGAINSSIVCSAIVFSDCPVTAVGSIVTVTAEYGYAPGAEPDALRRAVLMLISGWYENREGQSDMPAGVESIIRKFRRRAS